MESTTIAENIIISSWYVTPLLLYKTTHRTDEQLIALEPSYRSTAYLFTYQSTLTCLYILTWYVLVAVW